MKKKKINIDDEIKKFKTYYGELLPLKKKFAYIINLQLKGDISLVKILLEEDKCIINRKARRTRGKTKRNFPNI